MKQRSTQQSKKMWVISTGRYIDRDSYGIDGQVVSGPVSEYRISDIGLYLINPAPIKVTEKIIGYEVTHKDPDRGKLKNRISGLLPFIKRPAGEKASAKRVVDPDYESTAPFKDKMLESVFSDIAGLLRPYNPVLRQLNKEDENEVEDIQACCEHPGGHHYTLKLIGSISEKLRFLENNMYGPVEIGLNRAYMSNGVFEMRGFDFKTYNPGNSHRLIRYMADNKANYAVLNPDNSLKFNITVDFQVKFLQMLQQAIESDPKLLSVFGECVTGERQPFKLLFSKDLSATYSDTHLPEIFRNELEEAAIGKSQLLSITDTLNRSQRVVSLHTITRNAQGRACISTTITVMHDLRALESIKAYLPESYMEIKGNSPKTELGKLYLLDSISGTHV